ncbi:protein FAR1-RELATED SEQUENCE 4-like [Arachis duranensis]|uniref:Protein FAR1-RELATED SEQUENCE 4-like n=1 Tax=Arachis duranensis TaxID=130453 RepID=A0A6P4D106_ARADU|nr:protein FAR1-RELATED SEQUENCE 4-like [Arachis duranensis]
MLKQHRELSMFVRRTIELGFIEKDVRNYVTREVQNISEEDDAKEFGKYLVRMKEKNQNFFFELNLEGDHCIKRAFWADARSRAAFDYFGDVVSFDTTYNTNRHNLAPKGILTDQCASIQRAIELCMPTTIHRWCIWHIMKKIPSKLNGYKGHNEIEHEMSHVVWKSYTKEAFDRNWIDFLRKYGLGGNKWLSGFTTYEVIEQVSNSTFNKFVITYDVVSRDVKCHCLLFESRGILCRHSLSILSFERVDNVAPKYILECWSKNIKRRHTHIKRSQDEPQLRSKRFDELVFRSHNICEFASESEELTRILYRAFDKVMAEMEEYQERSKGKSLLTHEEATLSNVNDLQSPPRVKIRG